MSPVRLVPRETGLSRKQRRRASRAARVYKLMLKSIAMHGGAA